MLCIRQWPEQTPRLRYGRIKGTVKGGEEKFCKSQFPLTTAKICTFCVCYFSSLGHPRTSQGQSPESFPMKKCRKKRHIASALIANCRNRQTNHPPDLVFWKTWEVKRSIYDAGSIHLPSGSGTSTPGNGWCWCTPCYC